jgi:hypothetical protein
MSAPDSQWDMQSLSGRMSETFLLKLCYYRCYYCFRCYQSSGVFPNISETDSIPSTRGEGRKIRTQVQKDLVALPDMTEIERLPKDCIGKIIQRPKQYSCLFYAYSSG